MFHNQYTLFLWYNLKSIALSFYPFFYQFSYFIIQQPPAGKTKNNKISARIIIVFVTIAKITIVGIMHFLPNRIDSFKFVSVMTLDLFGVSVYVVVADTVFN